MEILELTTLTDQQAADLLDLMTQLNPELQISRQMLLDAAQDPSTHLFAAIDEGRIVGTASLCVSHSPTGTKGGIEDVVVHSSYRGRHLGRQLIQHLMDYAARECSPIVLHLTSRPEREAANKLYQALGFRPYETNVYKLPL